MEEVLYYIGQGFGVVAIALGFISFQMKTQKRLILAQLATAFVFCLHYALIGALTGMAMNIVATVRCVAYYYRNQKGSKSPVIPIIFTVCMATAGILTWTDWYSVFMLMGLVINTVFMASSAPQRVRASILVSSPLVIVYNIFAHSYGGIVYEAVAIVSSAIGIVRFIKKKKVDDICLEQ